MARGTRAATYFTPAEREQIRQAVVNAEAATSGEIATMLVDESDPYREAAVLGSILSATVLAGVLAIASGHTSLWSHIPLTLLCYWPCRWLFARVPTLKLSLVSQQRRNQAVRERALRAFYEQGLYRTREETGILLFVSLLERKVWILGDRGINGKIAPESWQELAGELSRGFRQGEAAAAFCRVIAACGRELARHFPVNAADQNELPDQLITQ